MDTPLAKENFERWAQALLSGDARSVTNLYAEQTTLLPTMAAHVITDHKGVEAYFTNFLSSKPAVSILEEHVITLSEDCYLHCGQYRFVLVSDEQEEIVDARFSMLWKKSDKHGVLCIIIHRACHHKKTR